MESLSFPPDRKIWIFPTQMLTRMAKRDFGNWRVQSRLVEQYVQAEEKNSGKILIKSQTFEDKLEAKRCVTKLKKIKAKEHKSLQLSGGFCVSVGWLSQLEPKQTSFSVRSHSSTPFPSRSDSTAISLCCVTS
jgi:hypothetical protein